MSATIIPAQNSNFKIGWIILLASAALMAGGHFFMIFIFDEPVLFTDFTAFNLLAFFILYIPFQRGEKWAWAVSWSLPVVYAGTAFDDPAIAGYFWVFAAACAAALLVTRGNFFLRR